MGLIEGLGTPESAWLQWLPEAAQGAQSATQAAAQAAGAPPAWLSPQQRLVVVAPHPDDEILACGGLLAMHVARGGQALIIAVTDGEASEPGLDEAAAARLSSRRRGERASGLACLGANHLTIAPLGLPDGRVTDCMERLQASLIGLLRIGDLVLATWRHDGHPDHEAVGRAAAHAAHVAGVRLVEAPVWMWHWARPDDPRVPWRQLHAVTLPEAVRERKQAALAAHQSQLCARAQGGGPVLGPHDVERVRRRHEHYFV